MDKDTWREFKTKNPNATVTDWLNSRTDLRNPTLPTHETKLDKISRLYGEKKRI